MAAVPGPKGTSVKVLERPGLSIVNGLAKNNPFPQESCGRKDCPWIPTGKSCGRRCAEENILYKAICTKCETEQLDQGVEAEKVVQSTYIGETSRSLYIRNNQHKNDYKKSAKDKRTIGDLESDKNIGFMWEHKLLAHNDETPIDLENDYKFYLLEKSSDPLTRQLTEACQIKRAVGAGELFDRKGLTTKIRSLNRKYEFFALREAQWLSIPKKLQKLSKYIIPTYMIYFWKSKEKKVSKKTFISIIGVINTN